MNNILAALFGTMAFLLLFFLFAFRCEQSFSGFSGFSCPLPSFCLSFFFIHSGGGRQILFPMQNMQNMQRMYVFSFCSSFSSLIWVDLGSLFASRSTPDRGTSPSPNLQEEKEKSDRELKEKQDAKERDRQRELYPEQKDLATMLPWSFSLPSRACCLVSVSSLFSFLHCFFCFLFF
jgi:hypothetical protein